MSFIMIIAGLTMFFSGYWKDDPFDSSWASILVFFLLGSLGTILLIAGISDLAAVWSIG